MSRRPRPRLVCLGNLTVDDTVLPDGTRRGGCLGGDALYAALGARLWEPAVEIVAPQGNDGPSRVTEAVVRAGFRLDGVPQRAVPAIHNGVTYDRDGGRRWTLYSSAADFGLLSPRPADVPTAYLTAEIFLISAMSLDAQEQLVPFLRARTNGLIALDLQEDYISGNEARLHALIEGIDIFMPSEEEVRRLLGHEEWTAAAERFAAAGPQMVVIKRGARGALLYDRAAGEPFDIPACPGVAVDTTGAGDAFCGGLLGALLHSPRDFVRAARAGAVAASFAIADFGVDALLAATPEAAADRLAAWRS